MLKPREYIKSIEEEKNKTGVFTQSKNIEDLYNKDVNYTHYCFYWVRNTGDQPLWTPKWHSTLYEKSFRVRKVGQKCSTITNIEEKEEKIQWLFLWILQNK